MKEMIRRIRDDRCGFTLAELLIVVAASLVLFSASVPVFSSSLHSFAFASGADAVIEVDESVVAIGF